VKEEASKESFELPIPAIEQKLSSARTGNSLFNPKSFYLGFAHGWNRCEGPYFWEEVSQESRRLIFINGRLAFCLKSSNKKFDEKLRLAEREQSKLVAQDWTGIRLIIDHIISLLRDL
jgi:hypothetical protein